MEPFGRFLLRHRVVSRAQLEEALQLQVILGVRLGTALVEAGHLAPEELTRQLSTRTGLPPAPAEWLDRPDLEALRAVPRRLLRDHQVLPLRLEKGELHVGVLDLVSARAIARHLSRPVHAYIVPEAQLHQRLREHLGMDLAPRWIELPADAASPPAPPRPGAPTAPRASSAADDLGLGALGDHEELIGEEEFQSLLSERERALRQAGVSGVEPGRAEEVSAGDASSPTAGAGASAAGPAADEADAGRPHDSSREAERVSAERAPVPGRDASESSETPPPDPAEAVLVCDRALERAQDRPRIVAAALALAERYARATGILVVRGDVIYGDRTSGRLEQERFEGLVLGTSVAGTLGPPARSGVPFRGALGDGTVDSLLLRALRRKPGTPVAILPVRLQGRVVNLLYADNDGDPIPDTSFGALQALCEQLGSAYERVIRERKRRVVAGAVST